MFGNDAPHWAYENCVLQNRCSPNSIENDCLGMMPHIGLMKIVLCRTGVHQQILKTSVWQLCPALGLRKLCFGEEVIAKQY